MTLKPLRDSLTGIDASLQADETPPSRLRFFSIDGHQSIPTRTSVVFVFQALRFRGFQNLKNRTGLFGKVVGARGFEPRTSCAQGRRATRLRYAPT